MSKKLLLLAVTAIALHAGAQNAMYVDSVKVLPQSPGGSDSVFLHIWWWSGYGTTPMPPTVVSAGNNHNVMACYTVGLIAVVSGGHDSIFVFQGPPGVHMITWAVMQNGTQSTSCDQMVLNGQEQVNVTLSGVDEHSANNNLVMAQRDFICNTAGTFRVYAATGQVVYEQNAIPGQRISINAPAGQMYFATLTTSEGEVSTIKFVLE